jgi:signal transduction histidine kinase
MRYMATHQTYAEALAEERRLRLRARRYRRSLRACLDRLRRERERRKAAEAAVAEKGRALAAIRHELRTPLTPGDAEAPRALNAPPDRSPACVGR